MTDVTCKPIHTWPGTYTTNRRSSPFRSTFNQSMRLLRDELRNLRASGVTLEIDVAESQIRRDGWPYAGTKVPPPLKLSFTTPDGPLTFATDLFTHWHDNLRAIALGLEALRKVDRYGITDRGQQYAGWRAIEASSVSADESLRFLAEVAEMPPDTGTKAIVRAARMKAHPDHGGNGELFARVQIAAEHVDGNDSDD